MPSYDRVYRRCKGCGADKHLDEFQVTGNSRRSVCKECRAATKRQRRWEKKVGYVPDKRVPKTKEEAKRARAERQAARRSERRQEQIDAYLAEHKVPPFCQCGCGIRVTFDAKGNPNSYINAAHWQKRNRQAHSEAIQAMRLENGVSRSKFADALREIKEREGMTWATLAAKAGLSESHLYSIIYDKGRRGYKTVTRELATDVLTRLANLPAPPSTYQRRLMEQKKKATQETRSKLAI